jgi:hypothetical protein
MMEFSRRSSAQCIHLGRLFKLKWVHPYIWGLSQKTYFEFCVFNSNEEECDCAAVPLLSHTFLSTDETFHTPWEVAILFYVNVSPCAVISHRVSAVPTSRPSSCLWRPRICIGAGSVIMARFIWRLCTSCSNGSLVRSGLVFWLNLIHNKRWWLVSFGKMLLTST